MTQDYRRGPAPEEAGLREPSQPPRPTGLASDPYQPAISGRPASSIPARKVLVAGVIVILLIIVAVVGRTVTSASTISIGDCVVTNPSVLTGWDIKKAGCNSNPGTGLILQKVVSVQKGSDGQCELGLTTFQDDPKGKTYCLEDTLFGNG